MKHHCVLTRLLSLLLVLLTVAAVPLTAFATEKGLPVPIEDGEDPMSGISLFAYNYNRIPEEMMDSYILRALAYTGYDVAYLKSIKKLYNKSYIASSLKKNAPDVLSGIPYSSDGSGSGLQTVTDKSTPTGKAPNIKHFKNETGLDCADFAAYYLCNYLPNIEGVDTSMFDEMKTKYGYRQDDMRFWMKGCEDLANQGRCVAYLLDSKDYENNTTDYQNAIANCRPGDLIRFGTSTEDWVHYAIYAGSYDGEDYIIHVANSRGPEISLIRYMTDSSSKTSVPLAFYHFYWNDYIQDGQIEVQKKNSSGNALQGAEFTAVNKDTGDRYLIGPTDSKGYAISEPLPYGEYTVTETKFPTGYQASGTTVWNVTVGDDTPIVTIDAVNTLITGTIGIKKADDTGKALSGVQFCVYSNSGCTTLVNTITTNSSGVATLSGLTPGTTYYLKEKAAPDGHVYNGTVYSVTVVANTTTYANSGNSVVNTRMGRLQILKKDKNGSLGAGYVFGIYSDAACTALVSTITTDDTGKAVSSLIAPGTYYVRETALPDTDTVHAIQTEVFSSVVQPGTTVTVTVINDYLKGSLGVRKSDDIGTPLSNALFGIYLDQDCTVSAGLPIRTDAEGVASVQLDIGTYYVRELEASEGHILDESIYPVTVTAGETAYINSGDPVVNNRMGRLRLLKQDKFGTLGAGFEFTLYADYKCTEPMSVFATDSTGIAISDWLPEGRYFLKETKLPEGSLHVLGTMSYSIDIHTGETYEITFSNLLQAGKIGVKKADDAGTPMTGIVFGVYSDPECTKMATMPFRTDENGVALCELEPGNYYVKELTKNPQYIMDTTVYPVTVTSGTTTYANMGEPVINTRKSKIELIKKDPDGILGAGYVFGIYSDEACTELLQTVTTDGTGTAFSDWLLPDKTYYVKEITLPEDDTIHAVSKEVFPLKLLPGEVGKVTVINEFLPGQITVLKTSQEGQILSGAKFLLEWSEDGRKWQKVVYNADRVIKGSCYNEDLTDGCLVTDSTGVITFTGLHPTLQYRITEIEAPEGYVLITDPVYTGTLPTDTLELGFTVVNAKPFELPQTGSKPMILMPVSLLLCTATCMGIFVYLRKKKKEA